jgi:hypothetical protein
MKPAKVFLTVGLLGLVLSLGQGIASAQAFPFRTNPYIQYAQNQAAMQQAYMQQLLYAQQAQTYNMAYYGSPYPNLYANNYYSPAYYPTYTPPAYYPPTGVPYGGNPYTPSAAGYGVSNPYAVADPISGGYNPYNPYNPYNSGYGAGSVLQGSADVIRAYGQQVNAIEQARLMREKALQEKLETKKKAFDLDMYIKANTPTYTQEQERNVKNTLRRIQSNATPGEVANGRALNLLLDDLRKFPSKKISLEPLNLSEDILTHLNVTKGNYGIGLLRDNGKVTWPTTIQDLMSMNQRQNLDKQLQNLVKEANNNRIDNNVLKDVRNEIERLREELVKKVNDIPTGPYMDSKRFLDELERSTNALAQGEAITQARFQRFIEDGKNGRSIQDVADYMVREGLRFGPATAADEAAYRAVHSSLATYDIAMNTQFAEDK